MALAGAPVPGEAGRPHIAVLAVDGTGITVAYRKLWLGAAEAERFGPGDVSPPYWTWTAGGSAWPSARTSASRSIRRTPPPWASTHTSPAP